MESAAMKRLHTQIFMYAFHIVALVAIISFYWIGHWPEAVVGFCVWVWKNCPGVGVSFHRLLVHKSFQTYKFIEYSLVCFGCLALQGSPVYWVAVHKKHHKHTEKPGLDPHTPLEKDNPLDGFSWAQWGWMLNPNPATEGDLVAEYASGLMRKPFYQKIHKLWWVPSVILGAVLVSSGWYLVDIYYGLTLLLYGYIVPVAVGWEITWLVNSLNHQREMGYRNFDTTDDSCNILLLAAVTFGEGCHNNHHEHQWSARHGLRWYERILDTNYWVVIRGLEILRLAWKVRRADPI